MSHWKPSAWNPLRRGHPLAQGLVGAFLMNEGGGTITMEGVGGAFPTELTAPWAAGIGNHGWEIGPFGASALLTFAHNPLWNLVNAGATPSTIAVILRFTGTANEVVFEKNGNDGFSVQVLSGEVVSARGSDFDPLCTSGLLNDGLPHVVAFVTVGAGDGDMSSYADGVFVETGAAGTSDFGSSTPLYIGHRGGAAPFASGNVIAAFMWDRALNADQVRAHYQDPYGMFRKEPLLLKPGAAPAGGGGPLVNSGLVYGPLIRGRLVA